MQDLKRTVYELEPEEFEKLYCQWCSGHDSCSLKPTRMVHCKVLIEIGRWGEAESVKDNVDARVAIGKDRSK